MMRASFKDGLMAAPAQVPGFIGVGGSGLSNDGLVTSENLVVNDGTADFGRESESIKEACGA